jgi:hypothetical protein
VDYAANEDGVHMGAIHLERDRTVRIGDRCYIRTVGAWSDR